MKQNVLRNQFKNEKRIDAIQFTRHVNEMTYSLDYVHWLEDMILNWNDANKDMPEYDGDYLCHIVRNNECGTISNYQEVVQCFCNNWITKDRETVTHWKKLMLNPEFEAV